jgi:UDP-2,3-diacylglucosamine pyrophosphatase LpxH
MPQTSVSPSNKGPAKKGPAVKLRTVFISDIHLGTRGCRADLLLEFLSTIEAETLVLVGDIVDVWALRRALYWPQLHTDVVRKILGMARKGTRVIYVPGNHDEAFREFSGWTFGNLEVRREYRHETADGRDLMVVHGDEFDSVVKTAPWLARLGSRAYDFLLWLNRYVNFFRRVFGFPYWSLAAYLKHKVKNAVQYIDSFEKVVAYAARRRGVDGVVCGHIHRPEITTIDGILYCNDGDWVESCSTLVEDLQGRLSLWNWAEVRERMLAEAAPQPGIGRAA